MGTTFPIKKEDAPVNVPTSTPPPAAPTAPLSGEVPQAVIDALNALQTSQDTLHTCNGTKAQTATALAQAQSADQAAAAAVSAALADLQQKFAAFSSVIGSVYQNPNA